MKNSIRVLVISVLAIVQLSFAQSESTYEQFETLPREKVYVSTNTSLLFTGEYLFYKMYCLNDKTKQPSKISTIGYVELINENMESVFKHKIRLIKSQGQGDFFVPTTIPSGNYKLIGYTRWMKNGSVDLFFQEDISIINPYRVNQDAILLDSTEAEGVKRTTDLTAISEDKRFLISSDKKSYPKKSKVIISLKNFRGASGYGNYNMSVRKKESLKKSNRYTPESYMDWHQKQVSMNGEDILYKKIKFAPELDGELIKGKLSAKNSDYSVSSKNISVSVPGEDFQMKVVQTDSTGFFHVNINKDYATPYAFFSLLDEDDDNYEFNIIEDDPIDLTFLNFKKFYIDSSMKNAIVKRSVYNQIENGYYGVKPDTLRADFQNDPYGGAFVETINLEEFTRFKTLEETIIEIVPNVWTKKNENGKKVFKVRSFDETYEESKYDALVYIDGVYIANPDEILDFEAITIKTINTIREKYRIGGKYYFGLVNIVTNEKDYFNQIAENNGAVIELDSPRPVKYYFNQNYSKGITTRIPDFRRQLLWKPLISFNEKETELSFFTSDVAGEYEVLLEGFSIFGRPVVVKETFTVN